MNRVLAVLFLAISSQTLAAENCPEFLSYDLPRLHSKETVNICEVAAGKSLLVINTASHCGYTRQFEGLEALHQKYKDQGLFVIGFASNDFNQEAKSEEEAARICRHNFGVSFTMVAPSFVKGYRANPIFKVINEQSEEPTWNFNKYLINKDGKVVKHFSSRTEPDSKELNTAIDALL